MGVKDEILELKAALEQASEGGSMEQILEVLKAIEKLDGITSGIVSETKIGATVKALTTQHAKTAASKMAKAILRKWTKVIKEGKEGIEEKEGKEEKEEKEEKEGKEGKDGKQLSQTPSTPAPTPTPPPPSVPIAVPTPAPVPVSAPTPAPAAPVASEVVSHESLLPEGRRKMFQLFFDMLQRDRGTLDSKQQRRMQEQALSIEFCVEAAFPCTGREYAERVRTLVINMKKNSALRDAIVSGTLPPAELATMPTAQLATEEVFRLREAAAAELSEARMLDWAKAHAADLARDCGVDPENVWEYDDDDVSDAGAD